MRLAALGLALTLASAATAVAAQTPALSPACQAKYDEIARDIDAAKANKQTRRVRGLETAQREVQNHCTDARLQAEHDKRVRQQEKKVAERTRELQAAEREGKADKIAKRLAKLAEEQTALDRLKQTAAH